MYSFIDMTMLELKQVDMLIKQIDRLPLMEKNSNGYLELCFRNNKIDYYWTEYKEIDGGRKRVRTNLGGPCSQELNAVKEYGYLREMRKRLVSNRRTLRRLVREYRGYMPEEIKASLPDAYQLFPPIALNDPRYAKALEWSREEYRKNSREFRDLGNIACDGTYLRSKNEVIIYNLLKFYGIPFRYEERLVMHRADGSRKVYYPDFTIMLADGSKLYWEHMGRLDLDDYREYAADKILAYQENGITLGYNLIITADSMDGGINSMMIERLISQVILPMVKPLG